MTPAPSLSHQTVLMNFVLTMGAYVREHGLGELYAAPTDVLLPTQPVPFEPDIVFVAEAHRDILGTQRIEGVPDLVVEILSPANWLYDRQDKFHVYQQAGIPEYWIVDYRARTVEVFVLEAGEYALRGKWSPGETASSTVLQGFEVALTEVFHDLPSASTD